MRRAAGRYLYSPSEPECAGRVSRRAARPSQEPCQASLQNEHDPQREAGQAGRTLERDPGRAQCRRQPGDVRPSSTKEFAALNPIVATIDALRAAEKERADLKALLEDPTSDKEMIALARADLEALEPQARGARAATQAAASAQGFGRREERHPRGARRHRRRRGGAVRRRSLPHVHAATPSCKGWKVEIISHVGERPRRLQGGHRLDLGRGRVRAPQVRIGRAPRAAHSRDRDGRAHPHLGGHRRGAARGRGRRHRYPARGHPHRYHARGRRRRPARQQDGIGRAHDASADRHRRRLGGEVAAPEPAARHAGAALARL